MYGVSPSARGPASSPPPSAHAVARQFYYEDEAGKAAEKTKLALREMLLGSTVSPAQLEVNIELAPGSAAKNCVTASYASVGLANPKWDDVLRKLKATGKLDAGCVEQVREAVASAKAAAATAAALEPKRATVGLKRKRERA